LYTGTGVMNCKATWHKRKESFDESLAVSICCKKNKEQTSYIKTNYLEFKITSVKWPSAIH